MRSFISYARKDNEGGWVTFVEALLSHRRFSGGANVFFDKNPSTMQDWRWRIARTAMRG